MTANWFGAAMLTTVRETDVPLQDFTPDALPDPTKIFVTILPYTLARSLCVIAAYAEIKF